MNSILHCLDPVIIATVEMSRPETDKILLHKSKAENVLLLAKEAERGTDVLLTCASRSLNAYRSYPSNAKYFQYDRVLIHHKLCMHRIVCEKNGERQAQLMGTVLQDLK